MKTDLRTAFDYPVPRHSLRIGYMLGGISGAMFIVMFASGILLAFFGYVPTVEGAHRGLEAISQGTYLSGIRSIHAFGAEVMVILLLLHITRIVATRAYCGDRKITWTAGVFLGGVVAGFYFTGTMLKWDQEGAEAFDHLAYLLGSYSGPLFGGNVPVKMLVIHAVVLPVVFLVLLGVHILFIKILGISSLAPGVSGNGETTGFLRHNRYSSGYALVLVGGVMIAAGIYTPVLLGAPVPYVEWTKPPWPFLFLYPLETYAGMWALTVIPPLVGAALLGLPLLCNSEKRWDVSQTLYVALLFLWGVLTVWAAWMPRAHHMM